MINSIAMIRPINQIPLIGHLINKITPNTMEDNADNKNHPVPGDLFNLNHKTVLAIPIKIKDHAKKAVIKEDASKGS